MTAREAAPGLTDEELELAQWDAMFPHGAVSRLIAALRASRAEADTMADALWAICDGDGTSQDRIIAAGGLGDRFDHSKPGGRGAPDVSDELETVQALQAQLAAAMTYGDEMKRLYLSWPPAGAAPSTG